MEALIEQYKQKFDELDTREKLVIIVGSIALVLLIYIFSFYIPSLNKTATLQEQIRYNQEDVEWMQDASKKIKASGGKLNSSGLNRSLLALLDENFKSAGLASTVKSIQPDGKSKANVRFEDCGFDALINLIATLESNNNVVVYRANIKSSDSSGRVSGNIVFDRS